mmetsp:Transcript_13076/g.24055  ORF Transcript_13076/g.24055 Transcript_13076/m.24055 type:complete len:235 (-) Transcript_13076:785-1489(-)
MPLQTPTDDGTGLHHAVHEKRDRKASKDHCRKLSSMSMRGLSTIPNCRCQGQHEQSRTGHCPQFPILHCIRSEGPKEALQLLSEPLCIAAKALAPKDLFRTAIKVREVTQMPVQSFCMLRPGQLLTPFKHGEDDRSQTAKQQQSRRNLPRARQPAPQAPKQWQLRVLSVTKLANNARRQAQRNEDVHRAQDSAGQPRRDVRTEANCGKSDEAKVERIQPGPAFEPMERARSTSP